MTGALLLSSGLSVALYGLRVLEARTLRHGFLVWNLFLAALMRFWLVSIKFLRNISFCSKLKRSFAACAATCSPRTLKG